ncbi:hypothetical protein EZV62_014835 [Acer yangbiense]|uniref:Peptidase S8/S53 domain-containing protein n=1 Tax=Acer yangbiense TaxID=1000413 RepID=A0A5C7HVN9_9ROSI|nr:hypothetical protein EZV62_014835 [Acer yangbiense]
MHAYDVFFNVVLPSSNSSKTTTGGWSPRDPIGHGTHVAMIAAGAYVTNVSYYGLARGTARGGSPSSRIASYKACSEDGCSGSTILKAIEDAIKDGVDMISISIGMSAIFQEDFLSDPIAIGAFHVDQMGVMVVCSAGNDGPDPSTVVNTAPWVFTVAASTIDREFKSTVLLGNGKTFQGSGIHLSNLSSSRTYPLAFGKDVVARLTPLSEARNPTATILPTVDVVKYKPAPVIAYFSSRGPGQLTENIIKPDITAPGVAILAAVVPIGQKPPEYATRSGTSMACPHVTGAAAFIRSFHHQWTSSMIKSALMTTATVYDNLGKPMTKNTGNYANPHEMGVGEISPLKALNPGLVFETTTEDYFKFLCYYGYSEKTIRSVTNKNFNCPNISNDKLTSNINYPSISISNLDRHRGVVRSIRRAVTNVGSPNATYIARVHGPSGLLVKVIPEKIAFSESIKRVSLKVAFYSKQEASSGYKLTHTIYIYIYSSLIKFDTR